MTAQLIDFPKILKSFAQAFSTPALLVKAARRVEGLSPSWVLRATPLTSIVNKGGQSPPLEGKECWASPKSISLSAESDQRLCLWNPQAFKKA